MTPQPRLRLVYFGGNRPRWRELLAACPALDAYEAPPPADPREPGRSRAARLAAALGAGAKQIARHRPHLLLAESAGPHGLVPLVLSRLFRVPLAVRVRGDPGGEADEALEPGPWPGRTARIANAACQRLVLGRADLLLPITAAVARSTAGLYGERPMRVVAIPVREPAVAPAARPPARPGLLSVTGFAFRAKIAPLVAAAPVLDPLLARLGVEWTVVGGGPLLASARAALADRAPRVRLVGAEPGVAVAARYAEGPLLLHLSELDGLPNVLLEAAAAGLAVVVNRGSAAAAFVADGTTGAVVDLGRPGELSARVEELLLDPGRRAALGAGAAAWVRERFAPGRVAADLEAALAGLVAGPG